MMARVIAWVVVIGAAFGVYKAASHFQNPWRLASTVSPVLSHLPANAPGCGEKCHD
jgi:hypothetical protein